LHNPPPFEPYHCPKCNKQIQYMKEYLANLFPPNIICKILGYIDDFIEIKECGLICKKWRSILLSSTPRLWIGNVQNQNNPPLIEKKNSLPKNTPPDPKIAMAPYNPSPKNEGKKGKNGKKSEGKKGKKRGTIGKKGI